MCGLVFLPPFQLANSLFLFEPELIVCLLQSHFLDGGIDATLHLNCVIAPHALSIIS